MYYTNTQGVQTEPSHDHTNMTHSALHLTPTQTQPLQVK